MKKYNKCIATAKVLNNHLLGAFEDDYFLTLYGQATGYEGSTIPELLQHLYTNYDQLDSTQLIANAKKLRSNHDLTMLIGKYIARMKKCIDIAANGGASCSVEKLLTYAYNRMYCTKLCNKKYLI
eukprot:2359978-Ditylum_brightwellii.AAC.1